MTVKELIELLNHLSPDLLVRFDDVHGGGYLIPSGNHWCDGDVVYLDGE